MRTAPTPHDLLGLRRPPVAVTFRDTAPAGVPRIDSAGPSSCAYWKLAAEGRAFYPEAADHHNCPIGANTHGIDPPAEVKKELEGVVSTLISLGYLRAEEDVALGRQVVADVVEPPGVTEDQPVVLELLGPPVTRAEVALGAGDDAGLVNTASTAESSNS